MLCRGSGVRARGYVVPLGYSARHSHFLPRRSRHKSAFRLRTLHLHRSQPRARSTFYLFCRSPGGLVSALVSTRTLRCRLVESRPPHCRAMPSCPDVWCHVTSGSAVVGFVELARNYLATGEPVATGATPTITFVRYSQRIVTVVGSWFLPPRVPEGARTALGFVIYSVRPSFWC